MTKLEILENIDATAVMSDVNVYDGWLTSVLDAMDQYAKDQSIAFAEWLFSHPLDFQGTDAKSELIGLDFERQTTERLYEIFLQQQLLK